MSGVPDGTQPLLVNRPAMETWEREALLFQHAVMLKSDGVPESFCRDVIR